MGVYKIESGSCMQHIHLRYAIEIYGWIVIKSERLSIFSLIDVSCPFQEHGYLENIFKYRTILDQARLHCKEMEWILWD